MQSGFSADKSRPSVSVTKTIPQGKNKEDCSAYGTEQSDAV